MSLARKDWSALSSLTKQWSLEDEEEQQRERRRRHRALSSTSEEASPQRTPNGEQRAKERLQIPEEVETPQPPTPDPQDEEQDVQALLRKRWQQRQAGGTGPPLQEQLGAEEAQAASDSPQAQPQPPVPQKEVEPQLPGRLNQTSHGSWARKESQENGESRGERKGVSDEAPLVPETSGSEKAVPKALAKRLTSEETPTSRKSPAAEKTVSGKTEASVPKPVLERKPSILERCSAFEKPPAPRETRTSSEKASVLEKSSAFKKPLTPREIRTSSVKASVLERSSAFEKPSTPKEASVLERSSAFEKPSTPKEASVLERSSAFEKPSTPKEASILERSSAFEKPSAPKEKASILERSSAFEKPSAQREKASVLERSSAFEKPSAPKEKASILERSSVFEKPSAPKEKTSILERPSAFERRPDPGEKSSVPERSSAFEKPLATRKLAGMDRRAVSEKAQLFERLQGTEKAPEEPRLAPRRTGSERLQAQEQPAPGGNPSPSGEQRAGTLPDKRPLSSAKHGEQGAAGQQAPSTRLPPLALQVKVPSREDMVEVSSPTQATFSSCLKRSSPRTISFRMSSRRENPEATLNRSASLRLPTSLSINPGRGEKVQEKLQKYQSAIQRSGSLKSPSSSRTEFLVTPTSAANVANKRHLFEKEPLSGSRASSVPRGNLQLPGAVTSKLSLWVSKSQESPEQDPQEVRKEPAASRRAPQEKQAEDSLDAEA